MCVSVGGGGGRVDGDNFYLELISRTKRNSSFSSRE